MNEENQKSLEEQIAETAIAEQIERSKNPALRWYLRMIFFMPTMVCASLGSLSSILVRSSWFARFQIDGDWIALSYLVVICVSTFVLGLFHYRLYDAMYPEIISMRRLGIFGHVVTFCLSQILVVPLTIAIFGTLMSIIL